MPKIEEKKEKVLYIFKGLSVSVCLFVLNGIMKHFAWTCAEENDNQIAERPERANQGRSDDLRQRL